MANQEPIRHMPKYQRANAAERCSSVSGNNTKLPTCRLPPFTLQCKKVGLYEFFFVHIYPSLCSYSISMSARECDQGFAEQNAPRMLGWSPEPRSRQIGQLCMKIGNIRRQWPRTCFLTNRTKVSLYVRSWYAPTTKQARRRVRSAIDLPTHPSYSPKLF